METVGAERVNRWRRGLLPAALVAIGLITVIFGDFTGDDRLRAGGVAIVGAAILMVVAGWLLQRPAEAGQIDPRGWASYLTQSSERGLLIVRPDQAEVYERAVSAFGADCVLYDRRQRGSGDRPGRARRSNGDNRSGASGQSLTSTSRRSDLRGYVSDQPQDAEVVAYSRIFDGAGSPCLLAWSLPGVHVRRPVDVHHRRRGSRAPDYGYCQRLRQLLAGRVARASHTTSADASAEGKASVARIGPHSRRQYSSTNTIASTGE